MKKEKFEGEDDKSYNIRSKGDYGILLDSDMMMIHPVGKASKEMSSEAQKQKDRMMKKRALAQKASFKKATMPKGKLSDVLIPTSKTRKK